MVVSSRLHLFGADGYRILEHLLYLVKARNHPCRLTISLIQMGAKGEVQPLDTG